MPTTASTIDSGSVPHTEPENPEVDASEQLRKRVYRGFALSVAIGLALAVFYIGGRVWAAHREPPAARIIKVLPETVPAVTASNTVTTAPEVIPSEPARTVAPDPAPAKAVAQPVHTVAAPVKTVVESAQTNDFRLPADWKVVEPATGQTYLQLAALGRRPASKYIPELAAKGLHPLVAAGPSEGLYRVLVGPFNGHEALKKAEQDLAAAGFETFPRTY